MTMLPPMPLPTYAAPSAIPACAGVGLKPEHAGEIFRDARCVEFFEVHAENYMGEGGPPHRLLAAIRERFPLSLHGVGLSIGGAGPLDREHLARLQKLIALYRPGSFSEHLAWSSHDAVCLDDLLPIPYDEATLDRVCSHIDQVQNVLGVRMLLENPSTYVWFESGTMSEIEFLSEIVARTGCRLLLDVNNVQVSAINLRFDAMDYIDDFPMGYVEEIHLAGYAEDRDEDGSELLIDAHDSPVAFPVWRLYERALGRAGPIPTLIEWDNDVPSFSVLAAEAARANEVMARTCGPRLRQAA
jgi:uncharacterized protein